MSTFYNTNIAPKHTLFLLSLILIFGQTFRVKPQQASQPFLTSKYLEEHFVKQKTEEIEPTDLINLHFIIYPQMEIGGKQLTFDQYYSGQAKMSSPHNVTKSYSEAITGLLKNDSRKYVIGGLAYFERYWNEASEELQDQILELVGNGQLSFAGSGYVQNDESISYYDDIIDSYTLGANFLRNTFFEVAKTNVNLNHMGHSPTNAYINAKSGCDYTFLANLNPQIEKKFNQNKAFEHLWTPQLNVKENPIEKEFITGRQTAVWFANTQISQWPMSQVCAFPCRKYSQKKLQEAIGEILFYAVEQQKLYQTKEVAVIISDKFMVLREIQFNLVDQMIDLINEQKLDHLIQAQYSTFNEYSQSVYKNYQEGQQEGTQKPFPDMKESFFPNFDSDLKFQTGVYAQKPTLKFRLKEFGKRKRVFSKMFAMASLLNHGKFMEANHQHVSANLLKMEQLLAMGHDHMIITDRASYHSINDVNIKLNDVYADTKKLLNSLISEQTEQRINKKLTYKDCVVGFKHCSIVKLFDLEQPSLVLSVVNPGDARQDVLRIQVRAMSITVYDEANDVVKTEIICENNLLYPQMLTIQQESKVCFLYLHYDFPGYSITHFNIIGSPLSEDTVFLSPQDVQKIGSEHETIPFPSGEAQLLFNPFANRFKIACIGGNMQCVQVKDFGVEYFVYENRKDEDCIECFNPKGEAKPFTSRLTNSYYFVGNVVSQITLVYPEVVIRLRVFFDMRIEVETYMPLPDDDMLPNRDLTIRFNDFKIDNSGVFYTDSNGLYMQKRKRQEAHLSLKRYTEDFYPVSSALYIEDPEIKIRMTVMTDRGQGGSSDADGSIELMVQRIIEGESEFEQLFEEELWFTHWLTFSHTDTSPLIQRRHQIQQDQPLIPFVAFSDGSAFQHASPFRFRKIIDYDIKISLRQYEDGSYLLRMQNMNEKERRKFKIAHKIQKSDGEYQSLLVEALLADWGIGTPFLIKKFHEKTINNAMDREDMMNNKLRWQFNAKSTGRFFAKKTEVMLEPLEIRTFTFAVEEQIKLG